MKLPSLRHLAAVAVLCLAQCVAPAMAQTPYGTTDLSRNTAVVDIPAVGPNGQTVAKAQTIVTLNPLTGQPASQASPVASSVSTPAAPSNLVALSGATASNGAFSFTAAGQYAVIDTGGKPLSLMTSGTFSATLQIQWTNDPTATTGSAAPIFNTGNAATSAESPNINTSGVLAHTSGDGRYAILRTTAYTSGTLVAQPFVMPDQPRYGGVYATTAIPPNLTTGQVSVSTTATQIVAARSMGSGVREDVTIINESTTPIRIGPSGVTAGTGALLPGVVGASITLHYSGAVFGIVSTGTAATSYTETYR